MRFLTILLILGVVGLLAFIGFALLPNGGPVVDTVTEFPTGPGGEQVITEVPPQEEEPLTPVAFEGYFGDDIDPVMQTFIDTHLNEYVFIVTQCHDSDEEMLTLALNFTPNVNGINTTEVGEAYLEENFTTIAPYVLTILGDNEYAEDQVVPNDFIMFDYDMQIYRSVHAIDGSAHELFHTWVGNSVYFTKSLECANDFLNDYYGSH